jgi:hypothetical protein
LFGDEEDVTFEEEEVALNGFEVSFETWVSVSARGSLECHFQLIEGWTDLWKLPEPIIFLPANARKTLDTTSYVGSS